MTGQEAAGRVAPTAAAISEEVRSASQTSSSIARRVGLASARRVSSTAINSAYLQLSSYAIGPAGRPGAVLGGAAGGGCSGTTIHMAM